MFYSPLAYLPPVFTMVNAVVMCAARVECMYISDISYLTFVASLSKRYRSRLGHWNFSISDAAFSGSVMKLPHMCVHAIFFARFFPISSNSEKRNDYGSRN